MKKKTEIKNIKKHICSETFPELKQYKPSQEDIHI